MRLPQLPGKGTSRPRLSEYLRPTRRLGERRRPQEAPGGLAGPEELALAHLSGARGPTGTKSGGARPAGRRLGSGASPARSPRPRRRPQPEANAAEPGRGHTGNRLSRQPSGRNTTSGGSDVIEADSGKWSRQKRAFLVPSFRRCSGFFGLGSQQFRPVGTGRSVRGQDLQSEGPISRSPERAEVGRGVQRRILTVQGSARARHSMKLIATYR